MVLDRAGLDRLVEVLIAEGYRVIGPTLRDGAIVLGELDSAGELPAGWGVETGPGLLPGAPPGRSGRVRALGRPAVLEAVPAPAAAPLWSDWPGREDPPRRSRLAALRLPRRAGLRPGRDLDPGPVLGGGQHPDGAFAGSGAACSWSRSNCTEPGGVCFCASMGTGPAAGPGYDIALTEQTGDAGTGSSPSRAPPRAPASWPRVPHRAAGRGNSRRPGRGRRGGAPDGPGDAAGDLRALMRDSASHRTGRTWPAAA